MMNGVDGGECQHVSKDEGAYSVEPEQHYDHTFNYSHNALPQESRGWTTAMLLLVYSTAHSTAIIRLSSSNADAHLMHASDIDKNHIAQMQWY